MELSTVIAQVFDELTSLRQDGQHVRRATKFISPTSVVALCRRHRPDKRAKSAEYVIKVGAPNYREREFVKACHKAGEPFPVKNVQLRFFPAK